MRKLILSSTCMLALFCAACGQKGPLYLPPHPSSNISPAATTPAPSHSVPGKNLPQHSINLSSSS